MAWPFIYVMKKVIELRKLTDSFYLDYPASLYPEIEQKKGRPYVVLLVRISENLFAIPLRTNIRHNYCYKFKNTGRKTDSSTGIDFTKAIVVKKQLYLGEETNIDDKEYLELQNKAFFIIKQFKRYVKGFILTRTTEVNDYLKRKYKYTTLDYFYDVLIKKVELVS